MQCAVHASAVSYGGWHCLQLDGVVRSKSSSCRYTIDALGAAIRRATMDREGCEGTRPVDLTTAAGGGLPDIAIVIRSGCIDGGLARDADDGRGTAGVILSKDAGVHVGDDRKSDNLLKLTRAVADLLRPDAPGISRLIREDDESHMCNGRVRDIYPLPALPRDARDHGYTFASGHVGEAYDAIIAWANLSLTGLLLLAGYPLALEGTRATKSQRVIQQRALDKAERMYGRLLSNITCFDPHRCYL